MKVLLAAASYASSISGIQRHAVNLARCLISRPEITMVDVIISPWQQDIFRTVQQESGGRLMLHLAPRGESSIGRNLWHYYGLPRVAKQLRPDIIHLSYPVPTNRAAFECPVVATLHDLYPFEIPENFRLSKVIFNRLVLKQCLHNVNAIACVSEATLTRLRECMSKAVWQKAIRIFNCVEHEVLPSAISPLDGWEGEPFLLCVAQHRRNKNIGLLLRVFRRLLLGGLVASSMKLVIVGIHGPETEALHRTVADLGLSHVVYFLQGISETELQWCYSHCSAVIVPSITEGFGLPVAEALLAGCRVICSDIDVLREIGGKHCWFVPLGEDAEAGFANTIAKSLRQDPPGRIPMPHLCISQLAAEYMTLYGNLFALESSQQTGVQASSGDRSTSLRQSSGNLREARRGRV